ncbi:MAG: sigma-54 dependent transcriptional regulator [Desulfobacterota bacterium]|nr:sigma-54 dependent transcriptional regulator [Thermodesulfobacteriota bacterium]MDW8002063.1 sigma-54 dependent transcriptional regulator [Deltaproteobacteria bacterium]
MKAKILLVEDDPKQRQIIKTILLKEGFYVEDVGEGKKAIEMIKENGFDLVITDLKLPDIDGIEVVKVAKMEKAPCHVIIITAYGSIPSAVEATKMGAFYYLEKPFDKGELLIHVNNAISQVRLAKDNILLKTQLKEKFSLDNIVGEHQKMQELFRLVKKIAPTNSTVLIYGESGTGKELFARSIHYNSQRREKPFFAINCASIPETLLESELFGYEKGAFTGAYTRHIGLLEQANGSTLFLDEVADLSLSTQAKLLRAIQEKEIRRIGGEEVIKLDVRIIAATNKRLEEEIKKGRFREDLFYRLNVISFTIPPLRERVTDIPLLVEHFLKKLNQASSEKKVMSKEALKILMEYHWPGNVRQLQSVVERAYILCDGERIGVEHLPDEVKKTKVSFERLIEIPDEGIDLAKLEKELIKKAIVKANGRLTQAAKLLSMPYDTFWLKVKRMREKGEIPEDLS